MKKFTRERVVPTISARVSWDSLGSVALWRVLLPVARQQQQRPGQALLTRVEELVDEIFLDPDVAGEHVRDEAIGKLRVVVQQADHLALGNAQRPGGVHGRGRAHAQRLAGEAPFAEEVALAEHRDHGLLAGGGEHRQLHAAALEIEDAVGLSALREHEGGSRELHRSPRDVGDVQERGTSKPGGGPGVRRAGMRNHRTEPPCRRYFP